MPPRDHARILGSNPCIPARESAVGIPIARKRLRSPHRQRPRRLAGPWIGKRQATPAAREAAKAWYFRKDLPGTVQRPMETRPQCELEETVNPGQPGSNSGTWRTHVTNRPWPRKGGARFAERQPAQEVNKPLKGRTPRMPPGWNKPGRCGRRDAQRAKEPCTRRRAPRIKERYSCRTRSSRKSRSSARKGWPRFSGRRNRSDGMRRWCGNHWAHSLCAAHRRGQEPQEGTQTDTSTSVQGPDRDRRPRAMRWNERQERCAGLCDLGRVMRRSEAEDLKSQAIAAKAEEDGRTDSALRQDCYR